MPRSCRNARSRCRRGRERDHDGWPILTTIAAHVGLEAPVQHAFSEASADRHDWRRRRGSVLRSVTGRVGPSRPTQGRAGSFGAAELHRATCWSCARVGSRFSAPLIGLAAAVLASAGAGVPSYWGDEAASVLSAGRPLPSLFALLGRVDAVHGLYYLFLHGWISLVGTSEALVRLPSAVAIGFAVAGNGGARQPSRRAVDGDPRRGGARGASRRHPYGDRGAFVRVRDGRLGLADRLARRAGAPSRDAIARVGGIRDAFAAALYLYLYLALLVLVQLAVVVSLRGTRRTGMRLLAHPSSQPRSRHRSSWSARRSASRSRSSPGATMRAPSRCSSASGSALPSGSRRSGGCSCSPRSRRSRSCGDAPVAANRAHRLDWVVVPPAVLLIVDAWFAPTYNPRYLSFCAPAHRPPRCRRAPRTRRRRGRIGRADGACASCPSRTGALAAVAVPGYLDQRGPFGKGGADFRQAADVIAAIRVRGDAIVFDDSVRPSRKPRLALNLYPDRFDGLDDVALQRPLAATTRLWDSVAPIGRSARCAAHPASGRRGGTEGARLDTLRVLGFSVERASR